MGCRSTKVLEASAHVAVKAEAPPANQWRHHQDPVVMLTPYVKIIPGHLEAWKSVCEAMDRAARSSSELLFYGKSFRAQGAGCCLRWGYRSAAALAADFPRTEEVLAQALVFSELERVEVHGPRLQLLKLKSQVSRFAGCRLQFFAALPWLSCMRRPTKFAGSDDLVGLDVAIQADSAEHLRALKPKLRAARRRARDTSGGESFGVYRCLEQGFIKLLASFDGVQAALEHLACLLAHFGPECLDSLEVHGPSVEVAQLQMLLGGGSAVAKVPLESDATEAARAALEVAQRRAGEDAARARLAAEAAQRALTSALLASGREEPAKGRRGANEVLLASIEGLGRCAVQLALDADSSPARRTGAPSAHARRNFLHGLSTLGDLRMVVEEAARTAFEAASSSPSDTAAPPERAMHAALEAAEEAAATASAELVVEAEAAQESAKAATRAVKIAAEGVRARAEEVAHSAEEEAVAADFAAKLAVRARWVATSAEARDARRATLTLAHSLRESEREALSVYVEAKASDGAMELAHCSMQAACWAVLGTAEQAFYVAYERLVGPETSAEQAEFQAVKCAEEATHKALALIRRDERLAVDALKAAEAMSRQPERKAFASLWPRTTAYAREVSAFRRSLYTGEPPLQRELQHAVGDAASVTASALEEVSSRLSRTVSLALPQDCAQGKVQPPGTPRTPRTPRTSRASRPSLSSPRVLQHSARHHLDSCVLLRPCFQLIPAQQEEFAQRSEELLKAAVDTHGLLYCSAAQGRGVAQLALGFRCGSALAAFLRRAEEPLAALVQFVELERVEVHGPKHELAKLKRHVAKLHECPFQFFEAHPKMASVRKPTAFLGQPGSDDLVSCHVTLQAASLQELKIMGPKVRAVHRCTRDIAGNESFRVSHCVEQGHVQLLSSFACMEAALQHLAYVSLHLGKEVVQLLELHGPVVEVQKLEEVATVGSASLKRAAAAAAKVAMEDVQRSKASAEAAARAVSAKPVTEGATVAEDGAAEALQQRAEELAQEAYSEAMVSTCATKARAGLTAQKVYRRAIQAAYDVRQGADGAARKIYEISLAAGMSPATATELAQHEAEATAHNLAAELAEGAQLARDVAREAARWTEKCGEADVAEEVKAERSGEMETSEEMKALQDERLACQASAELGQIALTQALAASAQRGEMLNRRGGLRRLAEAAVSQALNEQGVKNVLHVPEEALELARDRAMGACWCVAISAEEARRTAQERMAMAGQVGEAAAKAVAACSQAGAAKALAVFQLSELLAVEAARRAEAMTKEGNKSLLELVKSARVLALHAGVAVRCSLYEGEPPPDREIHEATEAVPWTVSIVVGEATNSLESAHEVMVQRLHAHQEHPVLQPIQSEDPTVEEYKVQEPSKVCC